MGLGIGPFLDTFLYFFLEGVKVREFVEFTRAGWEGIAAGQNTKIPYLSQKYSIILYFLIIDQNLFFLILTEKI